MPSDFRMLCQEGQDFETHIEVEWTEPCLVVRATNVNEAVETTIHEAAHVKLWEKGLGHAHGPKFWTMYGRMMDSFDHHGHLDSKTYDVE